MTCAAILLRTHEECEHNSIGGCAKRCRWVCDNRVSRMNAMQRASTAAMDIRIKRVCRLCEIRACACDRACEDGLRRAYSNYAENSSSRWPPPWHPRAAAHADGACAADDRSKNLHPQRTSLKREKRWLRVGHGRTGRTKTESAAASRSRSTLIYSEAW